MQIMPATYDELRLKHALGSDPFNPGDNILVGAAYLSEMFERFGEDDFLPAYNAGPQRYEDYLRGRPLSAESIDYVAGLASKLGLAKFPGARNSVFPDLSKSSIFVALTDLKAAVEITEDGAGHAKLTIGDAVHHPLFPAQRHDNIFARISFSDDKSFADLRAVHRSPADIFVARRAR